jgi:enamine deaminase RidA (YjgF/YER057c/UK114 family)
MTDTANPRPIHSLTGNSFGGRRRSGSKNAIIDSVLAVTARNCRMADHFTVPGLFPPPGYAHVAVVEPGERLVFTAGAVPLDATGALVGAGDFIAQTVRVLSNLDAALRAAGTGLEHVVNTMIYVVATEQRQLADVWSVVQTSGLRAKPHTSTLLGVPILGYTGQLVEITAVAVMPTTGSMR